MNTTRREFIAIVASAIGVAGAIVATPTSAGTGYCKITGCGCQGFSPASGRYNYHCIGKNAAGGTCNHLINDHN